MTDYKKQEIERIIESGTRLGFSKTNIIDEIYFLIHKIDKNETVLYREEKHLKQAKKLYDKYFTERRK